MELEQRDSHSMPPCRRLGRRCMSSQLEWSEEILQERARTRCNRLQLQRCTRFGMRWDRSVRKRHRRWAREAKKQQGSAWSQYRECNRKARGMRIYVRPGAKFPSRRLGAKVSTGWRERWKSANFKQIFFFFQPIELVSRSQGMCLCASNRAECCQSIQFFIAIECTWLTENCTMELVKNAIKGIRKCVYFATHSCFIINHFFYQWKIFLR